MGNDASGFSKKSSTSHAHLNVPTLMQVVALIIIIIRCLDLLMIFNTPGFHGTSGFIHRSVQTQNLALVFPGSLVLLFTEVYYAPLLIRGRNWTRQIHLLTQIIASVYLWAVSLDYGYPELFSIAEGFRRGILHALAMQKLPDMLVLLLLFVPVSSRRFFHLQ